MGAKTEAFPRASCRRLDQRELGADRIDEIAAEPGAGHVSQHEISQMKGEGAPGYEDGRHMPAALLQTEDVGPQSPS